MNYNLQKPCPCQSQQTFADCCSPLLAAHHSAKNAISILRSRYTAYCLKNVKHLTNTLAKQARENFNASEVSSWVNKTKFIKLSIIKQKQGLETDTKGWIEFKALVIHNHQLSTIKEISCFEKIDDTWYYTGEVSSWNE